MKKIKYICAIILIVSLLVLGVIGVIRKKDYNYYLVLGDYISKKQVLNDEDVNSFSYLVGEYLKEEKVVSEVNDGYLLNNMTSKKLLEMIEKDTYIEKNKSLAKLIEKSKYITLTLGINDVISQLRYDKVNDVLIYDRDVIVNKIEIFKHNYHEIISEIKNLNPDVKILQVGCYSIYNNLEVSGLLNDAIEEVANEFDNYYIDVSEIQDGYMYSDNPLYLTSLGQEEISKKVIFIIKEIEE